jgi:hypothetical protein
MSNCRGALRLHVLRFLDRTLDPLAMRRSARPRLVLDRVGTGGCSWCGIGPKACEVVSLRASVLEHDGETGSHYCFSPFWQPLSVGN